MYHLSVSIQRHSLTKLHRIVIQFNLEGAFAQAFTSEGRNTVIVSHSVVAAIISPNPDFFFVSIYRYVLLSSFSADLPSKGSDTQ